MISILLFLSSPLASAKPTRCELTYVHRCKQIVEQAGRAPNRLAGREVAERNSADAKPSDWQAAAEACTGELHACEKACHDTKEKCSDGMKASFKLVQERAMSVRQPAADEAYEDIPIIKHREGSGPVEGRTPGGDDDL